jgi:hypothetical protein
MAYAEDVAEERKNQTADYIHSLSVAILSGGQSLENEGYGTSANFVEQVAEQIGGLADQLADREPRELLREVERFARDRPALFLGGALLAGLGISRFLKSTSPASRSANTGDYRDPGADPAQRSHPEAFS